MAILYAIKGCFLIKQSKQLILNLFSDFELVWHWPSQPALPGPVFPAQPPQPGPVIQCTGFIAPQQLGPIGSAAGTRPRGKQASFPSQGSIKKLHCPQENLCGQEFIDKGKHHNFNLRAK